MYSFTDSFKMPSSYDSILMIITNVSIYSFIYLSLIVFFTNKSMNMSYTYFLKTVTNSLIVVINL